MVVLYNNIGDIIVKNIKELFNKLLLLIRLRIDIIIQKRKNKIKKLKKDV